MQFGLGMKSICIHSGSAGENGLDYSKTFGIDLKTTLPYMMVGQGSRFYFFSKVALLYL